ncbi:unnamed protein product [Sympodiomycopsis kandeliae]
MLKRTIKYSPAGLFRVVETEIVPDDPKLIQEKVKNWIDVKGVKLVLTTGGTGFGLRDGTPEALVPLFTKPTPGLSHALTAWGLSKTPLAALSRLTSGIRQLPHPNSVDTDSLHGRPGALIVALPGSFKAVKECLELLMGTDDHPGILPHALHLCAASLPQDDEAVKETHQQLQSSNGQAPRNKEPANEPQQDHAPKSAAGAAGAAGTETDTGSAHTSAHTSAHHHDHKHTQQHEHHHHHHSGHSHGHTHGAAGVHSHAAPKPRTNFATHSPHGPSTARSRQSPYPILPMAQALQLIDQHTPKASQKLHVPVDEHLVGFVLAQDVRSSQDLPPGNTTNVDGYAVAVSSTPPGEYTVVTASELAQREPDENNVCVKPGEVVRVNTGQALPQGTNGVVMVEDTELISTSTDMNGNEEESRIKVLAQIDPLENVRKRGSDVHAGQIVLTQGTPISALGGEIGTLAFLGVQKVSVYRKPKVAVLSTGDELRELQGTEKQDTQAWGFKVFDANRPGLKASIKAQGLDVVDLGILGDDTDKLVSKLKQGLETADVILTTGGTSMGESDLLKPIIERELKGEIHFGRVSMKPGKPTTFATIKTEGQPTKIIFALPGNPASALVTFYIFVLPCLRKMIGHLPRPSSSTDELAANPYSLPRVKVQASSPLKLDTSRPEFHRVVIHVNTDSGKGPVGTLIATSTGSQRSSGMHSMSTANGLVCLPTVQSDGRKVIEVGEMVDAVLLGTLK